MMRALLLLWSLGPLLWQLRTSFLVGEVLVGGNPPPGVSPWTLANYQLVLSGDPSLARVLLNSAVLGAVEVCPTEVPADVRKKVEEVLKNRSAAPAAKPAPAPAKK